MSATDFRSLTYLERKEYEELKQKNSHEAKLKRDRTVLLGFFVVSLLATLMISGALNFF